MPIKKEPKTVSVREFLRNFKKLTEKKETLIIQKNGKPSVVFVTYEEWEKTRGTNSRVINIEELKPFMFKGGDPDLSSKIDEILYDEPYK